MRPDADAYSGFFDLLRTEGCRTQAIDTFSVASLRDFGALLVGVSTREYSAGEVSAIHAWVAAGGALLLVASMGGDDLPGGERHTSSNLFQLAPGVTPNSDCLGRFEGTGHDGDYPTWHFQRYVPVDVSALIGRPATLGYDSGCTLTVTREPPPPATPGERRAASGWDLACAQVEVTHAWSAPGDAHVVLAPIIDDAFYSWGSDPPSPLPASGDLYVQLRYGKGTVTVFGAAESLTNEGLARDDTLTFALWMLGEWLPEHALAEIHARKTRPQRHRMLHGYPMAPLMPAIDPAVRATLEAMEVAPIPEGSGLIVGVLPHPFCNPQVRGCGFCTFPHEVFSNAKAHAVTARVAAEIDAFRERAPFVAGRRVDALYLGGGTANLTPPDDLVALGHSLGLAFDLTDAEITLEGVPVYFTARRAAMLDAFERGFAARHLRLSMGIQTFDGAQIARMGRGAFGDRAGVEGVVREAHARGMTVSGDLLFDLPGQTLDQMLADVDTAVGLGLDHVCLYHLVLFEGLGTEWSHDRSLVAALPDNPRACDNWNALRDRLLASGFVQTSLTNFERADVNAGAQRFRYEPCAYTPERYDLFGFGPAAISLRFGAQRALKLLNADGADAYARAVDAGAPRARAFVYGPRDARILYLTRKIVTLGFDRGGYRALFGADALDDFARELEALRIDRLVTVTPEAVSLTPKGMFYADTVAGILAWREVHARDSVKVLKFGRLPRPAASVLYDANNSNFDAMG